MEFVETKSNFKDFTAFEEIYLMEHSMEMQKSSTWSSSMVLSFKDSMANFKSNLMKYLIIMQIKRLMEFFKKVFYLMKYSIGMYKKGIWSS